MKQKLGIILISIVSLTVFFIVTSFDDTDLSAMFYVDAIYDFEKKQIEIIFEDRSQKSSHITLEVLGMKKSFQKEFTEFLFVEKIPLESPPTNGWHSMPVTFLVEHKDLGSIIIKTEIHSRSEKPTNVIFGKP